MMASVYDGNGKKIKGTKDLDTKYIFVCSAQISSIPTTSTKEMPKKLTTQPSTTKSRTFVSITTKLPSSKSEEILRSFIKEPVRAVKI